MVFDSSFGGGYPEQLAATVFESPNYTEPVDLGPAMPTQGGSSGFGSHHGVLLAWLFAIFMLFVISWLFKSHNLG